MKKFTTLFLLAGMTCVMILGLGFQAMAQKTETLTHTIGTLERITPRLADLDRTSMYGKPFVITRDENGPIYPPGAPRKDKSGIHATQYLETANGLVSPATAKTTLNAPSVTIDLNIAGLVSTGLAPGDPNMAVGPNHIIQTVNHSSGTQFIIRDKTGALVQPATILSSLTGFAGLGDPIVFWDQLADRWVLTEFGPSGQNYLVIAVSTTPNPTGTYAIYRYQDVSFFPDYPKYSVWHNAYYATTNDFIGSYQGSSIWAFDKVAMQAGNPTATMIRMRLTDPQFDYYSMAPVCQEGMATSNMSGMFMYVSDDVDTPAPDADSIYYFTFTPDFAVPANSVRSAETRLQTAPFDYYINALPQQGSGQTISPLNFRLMNKVIYRNFGTHESIVACQTVDMGGNVAGIHWLELRRPGAGNYSIFQEGFFAPPDGQSRFMGAPCITTDGDIAILYNVTGPATFPSLRLTARNACDPPGQMTLPETVVMNGNGPQVGHNRYGDYNSLSADPVNGSFWGTGQWTNSASPAFGDWDTRIVNFTVGGGCAPLPTIVADGFTLTSESCLPNNGVIDPGETVTVSFCLRNTSATNTINAVGTLQATGGVITPSGPQNYGVIVGGGPQVCRSFTFTNNSSICGATITASIQVQDGPDNLGIISFPITLGTTATVLNENFDGVVAPALPGGWLATNAIGPAPLWVTSNSGTPAPPSVSAPNSAYVDNPAVDADKRLETPVFIPAVGARLTFQNNWNFEAGGFDGGVLEISVNGGAYQDILAAGGSFTAGGYNGTVSTCCANPIQGRAAWINSSGGFVTTTVNLPNAASGQSVRVRFRMGSDFIFGAQGWRLDNVSITQPSCCGAPCTITCPANITVNASASQCGATVTYPPATTSGLCGPVTYSRPSGSFFPVGTTTVTATTGAGPFCTFTVTVVDATPPTITCPANITVSNNAGVCGAVVNYNLPAVTDNCPLPGTVSLSQSTNNSTISSGVGIACPSGDNHFWRAYTLSLPTPLTITSVRFGVEVNGTAQVATVKLYTSAGAFPGGTRTQIASQTVNLTTASGAFYTANFASPPTVPGNAIVAIEIDVPSGGMWPGANTLGETAPSYISSATCGVPNPVTMASLGFTSHFIIDLAGTVPVVPPVLTQTAGLPSGSTFPVGTTTNTFTARDAAGNTSTCSFTVTVNDTEQPTISCPANQTRNTDPGQCYATYTPPQPTFADNCLVTRLTWTLSGATTGTSPATGINYVPSTQFGLTGTTGVGVTTVTYTAADAAGNTRTCSFTVTVNDASIPVISTQPATRFVCVGSDAVFSITASAGAGNPLTYQWQSWNGSAWVNIAGATASTLTVPAVTFAMNTNSYRCVLTGRCSVVNSNFATLYINPLPSVTVQTSIPPAILPGQSLNIISTVSPGGGTYAWYRNGVLLTSPLQQGAVLSGLTVDDLGTYRLVYTDLNGCVNTSADVVVSGQSSEKLWVYPVPNNGQFQVRFFNQVNEQATIRVFDAKGSRVYERSVVTTIAYTRMDVDLGPAMPDGTYVVELVNAAGNRVGAKKIIVRKKP